MTSLSIKYLCPITHDRMTDPVLAPDTYNYERSAIMQALAMNPISPMTRQPMTADQLIENRELRQEIESAFASADTVMVELEEKIVDDSQGPIVDDSQGPIVGSIRQSGNMTQVSIDIPEGQQRSLNICFVSDVSGSMNREVTTSDGESDGFNMLDIANHGINVCLATMRSSDSAGLVTFAHSAQTICPVSKMDQQGKARAAIALAGLSPGGSTNLWDGIKTGLDMMGNDGIIFVLTDGEPTVRPPRGERGMLNKWLDSHPEWHGQIHTFGFGYSLDSELLNDLCVNGRYSFMPDASLIGTVFVHAMANVRTTCQPKCVLSVETEGELENIGRHLKTSWGYEIDMGPLMYGRTRHYFLKHNQPVRVKCGDIEISVDGTPVSSDDRQRTAIEIFKSLQDPQHYDLMAFANSITCPKLLGDIHGQWAEALKPAHFRKWGRHYLPSLANAHMTQTCNNFLDKGIQKYGGEAFRAFRDHFDAIFNDMPAPKASVRHQTLQRMTSQGRTMRASPASLASYNDRAGPCFAGWCKVETPTGPKTLASVKKGDLVMSANGTPQTVLYVLKTMLPAGHAYLVKIGNLYVTEWHPIRSDKWIFPSMVGSPVRYPCDAIYSLALVDAGSECMIEGVECICLGHNIENDDVASHPFFGTQRVIECIRSHATPDGIVTLQCPSQIMRDEDNLVCGFNFS